MPSNKIGKDELIELFKEMKLTQKKYDEGIKIYEEKYEKKAQKKENKIKGKKEDDIDIHKQPLKPYFIFQKYIMEKCKENGEKIKRCEIGKMWKELNDDEKTKYTDKYKNELKKYNEKFNINITEKQ